MAPSVTVLFLPILSEKIPVGISKIADENIAMEKILIPKANEPDTLVK